MSEWMIEQTEQYERDKKFFEKKYPDEMASMLKNLDKYFEALNQCGNPLQVSIGFIHNEPVGIKAIDQKGGGKKHKLQQTRLYIFPNINTNILYLLAIGNKTTQRDDIGKCREFVVNIKGGK